MGTTHSSVDLKVIISQNDNQITSKVYNSQTGEYNDLQASIFYSIRINYIWYLNGVFYTQSFKNSGNGEDASTDSITIPGKYTGDKFNVYILYYIIDVIVNNPPINTANYKLGSHVNKIVQFNTNTINNFTIAGNIAQGIVFAPSVNGVIIDKNSSLTILGVVGDTTLNKTNIIHGTFTNGDPNVPNSGVNLKVPYNSMLIIGRSGGESVSNFINYNRQIVIDGFLHIGNISSSTESAISILTPPTIRCYFDLITGKILCSGVIYINADAQMTMSGDCFLKGGSFYNEGNFIIDGSNLLMTDSTMCGSHVNVFNNSESGNVTVNGGNMIFINHSTCSQMNPENFNQNNGKMHFQATTMNATLYIDGAVFLNKNVGDDGGTIEFISSQQNIACLILDNNTIFDNLGDVNFISTPYSFLLFMNNEPSFNNNGNLYFSMKDADQTKTTGIQVCNLSSTTSNFSGNGLYFYGSETAQDTSPIISAIYFPGSIPNVPQMPSLEFPANVGRMVIYSLVSPNITFTG